MLHGTADILYPGTRDMASRLDKLGVPNRFIVGRGMPHVYPLLTTWISEIKEAREIIVDVVR
jgi:acetyl esterase/lipase